MKHLSTFLIIFGLCVFFVGLYAHTGHEIGILTERPAFKNLTKKEWENIGKWTMVAGLGILAIAVFILFLSM